MRPISLKLKGFKGIRSNSGKDELFLDLSHLEGLVALAGPNGAGKTTILDNLHPYRIMPYRSNGYTSRSFSFYNECYGRDASKESVFLYGGQKYKSLVLIDAERKKQEAYLFTEAEGEWKPLTDGKVDNYDNFINSLLGTPQLFFTSVFRCQDAAKLSDYTKGEIKDIFVELLGIEQLKEIGNRAKNSKEALTLQLEKLKTEKQGLQKEIESAETSSKEAEVTKSELESISRQIKEIETQIEKTHTEIQEIKAHMAVQEAALKEKQSLETDAKRIREEIAKFNTIIKNAVEIRNASETEKKLSSESVALKKELAYVENVIENLHKIFSDFKDAETVIAEKQKTFSELSLKRKHRFDALKKDFEQAQRSKKLLEEVPCEKSIHDRCLLLKDAVMAKNSIPEMISSLHKLKEVSFPEKKLTKEIDQLKEKIRTMENIQKNLDASNKKRDSIKNKIQSCTEALEKAHKLSAKLPEVELAERSVPEHAKSLKGIEHKLSLIKTNDELNQKENTLDKALKNLSVSRKSFAQREAELRQSLGALEAQINKGTEAAKKVRIVDMKVQKLSDDISEWTILENAFSNDGIIALEIDDAGPTISAIANDLLQSCFGPRFSVRIDTQVAKSNGKGLKETFDIVIYDSERNESKSLKKMSGGEKIWVEESITRAISLYNASKSGRKYHTLFTDEKDGALDYQKKKEFMAMKSKVLELGGYDMELFISQSPEIQEIADHTISLAT